MSAPKKIFIIGGTGAQGLPIIDALTRDAAYSVRILTRDTSSRRAQSLLSSYPGLVELIPGTFTSESDVRAGLAGCWGAFVNIDGFAVGEALEIFYTMRCYELAIEAGVKMYVHGNIDFGYKVAGYNGDVRCAHTDGKGRVGEWILMSNEAEKNGKGGGHFGDGVQGVDGQDEGKGKGEGKERMVAALFTTGPYIDMAISPKTPLAPVVERDEGTGEEVLTWRVPLGKKGSMPHVALDDVGVYVRWLFEHPGRADGMDLRVAMGHIGYDEVAAAFEKITGRRAKFVDISLDEFWRPDSYWGSIADQPCGYTHVGGPIPGGVMTIREDFTGWFKLYQGFGQGPILKRDFALLDEIHPGRIRTAEEFFRREDAKARKEGRGSLWDVVVNDPRPILKVHEDGSVAPLGKGEEAK